MKDSVYYIIDKKTKLDASIAHGCCVGGAGHCKAAGCMGTTIQQRCASTPRATHLTFDEMKRLDLATNSVRERVLVRLLFETGCTVREALDVRYAAISSQKRTVQIGAHTHALSEGLMSDVAILRAAQQLQTSDVRAGHVHASDFLFASRQGRMTERRVQQLVGLLGRSILGRKLTPHMIRSGYIIAAFINNKPIDEIERIVGINLQSHLYAYMRSRSPRGGGA